MMSVRMSDLVRRAVAAVQYGPEPLEWKTVVDAVASDQAEVFIEHGADGYTVACCVVFFTGEGRAQIGLFYREGAADGLIRDMRRLMRNMISAFERRGVANVYAQVETDNKQAERLMQVYRRVSGFAVNSVFLHATVAGLKKKNKGA